MKKLTEKEELAVMLAYETVYSAYKKAQRARTWMGGKKHKDMAISIYKERLHDLQNVMNDKLGMMLIFDDL